MFQTNTHFKILDPSWVIAEATQIGEGQTTLLLTQALGHPSQGLSEIPPFPIRLTFGSRDWNPTGLLGVSFEAGPRQSLRVPGYWVTRNHEALQGALMMGSPGSLAKPGLESVAWFGPTDDTYYTYGALAFPNPGHPQRFYFGDHLSLQNFAHRGPVSSSPLTLTASHTNSGAVYDLPAEHAFDGKRLKLEAPNSKGALDVLVTDVNADRVSVIGNSQPNSPWTARYLPDDNEAVYFARSSLGQHAKEGFVLRREAPFVENGTGSYRLSLNQGSLPSLPMQPRPITPRGLKFLGFDQSDAVYHLNADDASPGRKLRLVIPDGSGNLDLVVTHRGPDSLTVFGNPHPPIVPDQWASYYLPNEGVIAFKKAPVEMGNVGGGSLTLARETPLVRGRTGSASFMFRLNRVARFLGAFALCVGVFEACKYFQEENYKKAGLALAIAATQNSSPCLSSALEYCKAYV